MFTSQPFTRPAAHGHGLPSHAAATAGAGPHGGPVLGCETSVLKSFGAEAKALRRLGVVETWGS